jgi:hypothetical protein
MKIYLDSCSLQRPLDNRNQIRIALECDYFFTCDDRFLRRAEEVIDLQTTAVSPLELVEELEG